MSTYTNTDFVESMRQTDLQPADVRVVWAAWGEAGSYSEWSGGFLLITTSDQYVYVTGWCDTTGWGCQDGVEVKKFDRPVTTDELGENAQVGEYPYRKLASTDWDLMPSDLNLTLDASKRLGEWGY